MDIREFYFSRLQGKIFRLLCIRSGDKLSQREIARYVQATPTGVAKALKELEKKGYVKIQRSEKMNLHLVSLYRDQKTLRIKQLENLKQLFASGLVEFLEESYPGTTIILFGSYARGEDIISSDIDIAVIGAKDKRIKQKKFEKLLERHININFYLSLRSVEKGLRENLCNGIVLSGGVEL